VIAHFCFFENSILSILVFCKLAINGFICADWSLISAPTIRITKPPEFPTGGPQLEGLVLPVVQDAGRRARAALTRWDCKVMNSKIERDCFLIEVDNEDEVWRALQEIARGNLMESCHVMIERGATKQELYKTLEEVLIPEAHRWMRAAFAYITGAIECDSCKTRH
jgi:hypothetical protein